MSRKKISLPTENASTKVSLLDGEKWVDIKNNFLQEEVSDEDISAKYIKGEIRIVTEQSRFNLPSIPDMLSGGKYNINPEYQRRRRWNNIRKSRLIESVIINVPIPPIFLYESAYGKYEVMDGLQRLTTIDDFYKNRFNLEGLTEWKELNGRTYSELPETIQGGIDRRFFSSFILLEETAKNEDQAKYLKQFVFERLNSGGERLTAQETRNALYNGAFNQLCIRLAKNESFRRMWQLPLDEEVDRLLLLDNCDSSEIDADDYSDGLQITPGKLNAYRKMEDVELVLRFFAYRHIENLDTPLDDFLDRFLKHANGFDQATIDGLENIFNQTIELIYNIFGKTAFVPPRKTGKRQLPLKIVYDAMMQAFSQFIAHREILIRNTDDLKKNIFHDTKLPPDFFKGRDNTKKDIKARIDYFINFLNQHIH
jgi:hypothetical protein